MIKKEASQLKDIYSKGSGKTFGLLIQLKIIFATFVKSKPPSKQVSALSSKSMHRFVDTLPATQVVMSFQALNSSQDSFIWQQGISILKETQNISSCFLAICWRSWSWIPESSSHSTESRKLKTFQLPDLWEKEPCQGKSVFTFSHQGRSDKAGNSVRSINSASVRETSGLCYVHHYRQL